MCFQMLKNYLFENSIMQYDDKKLFNDFVCSPDITSV
jgi:hypothetical protein